MVKLQGNELKKLLIAVLIIVVAITTTIIFLSKQKDIVTEEDSFDPSSIVTESLEEPDESIPQEKEVAPDLPKRIIIPEINVNGFIQLVSTDQYERIAVPSNIHIAGWYINSVRPGEEGLSILDGHRNGKLNPGIFYNLENLEKEDKISIEFGDGSLRDFLVIDVMQIVTDEAQDVMYERLEGIEKQLVLVTCGGEYDTELKTYVDRIIVRARGI